MTSASPSHWIAFGARTRIARGSPREVVERLVAFVAERPDVTLHVFDGVTSQPVDLDLRGSPDDVLQRLPQPAADSADAAPEGTASDAARGPGRPRLGVVAREVTLLPRHWAWLTAQPGGASVALRKLVEQALRGSGESERARLAMESAYRFMHAMAGDEPGFEEAARALFANDAAKALAAMAGWPDDVRTHAAQLLGRIGGAATPAVDVAARGGRRVEAEPT